MKCVKLLFEALQAMTVGAGPGGAFVDKATFKKRGEPAVPGSSVKGVVKKVLLYSGRSDVAELLGRPDEREAELRFLDCKVVGPKITTVRPGVKLNSALGTVSEKRLFYKEKVAMGTRFECEVCGEEEAIKKLVEALSDPDVKKYFYYVGLGDAMVELVEVRQ